MKNHRQLTFFMVYWCKMRKIDPEGIEEINDVFFHSRNRRLLSIDEFEEEYEDAINTINGKLGDYMGESSGWVMESISTVDLSIAKYAPIRGSSHIPTPKRLVNKKAIVNVQNKDQKCFFCILC